MRLVQALLVVLTLLAAACGGGSSRPAAPKPEAATPAPAPAATAPAAAAPAPVLREGAHADHDPKHGGLLFMDGNLYHHLEGTYPEAGLFRLYLYDDYTKPIDAAGTTGTVRLQGRPDAEAVPLEHETATGTLVARIPAPPAPPLVIDTVLQLTNPLTGTTGESRFSFPFSAIGGEAPVPHDHGDHDHGGHDHAESGHAHGPGEHEHVAPHGGQVATVGSDLHFELVESPGMLTLWILDGQEKTLPVTGMEASLLIQPDAGAPIALPMPPMGSVHFMANSPLTSGQGAVAVATVKIGGSTRTARFTLGNRK